MGSGIGRGDFAEEYVAGLRELVETLRVRNRVLEDALRALFNSPDGGPEGAVDWLILNGSDHDQPVHAGVFEVINRARALLDAGKNTAGTPKSEDLTQQACLGCSERISDCDQRGVCSFSRPKRTGKNTAGER